MNGMNMSGKPGIVQPMRLPPPFGQPPMPAIHPRFPTNFTAAPPAALANRRPEGHRYHTARINPGGSSMMDSKALPSLFVSHGAPSLVIERNETVAFLRSLGARTGRPRAVLCVSAHWETDAPVVSAAERPETIHDFGGFPAELYRMRYPAPGAPDVAARTVALLAEAGIEAGVSPDRGLDHGAWVPLSLIYPQADIPVTQLSIQPRAETVAHSLLGRALAPLRREGVLLLATGSATHNLFRIGRGDAPPPEWAVQFDEWLDRKITSGSYEELMDYRRLAPSAELAHPTEEHLLPLFVAAGAGEGAPGRSLHRGWTHGSLSMACYAFGGNDESSAKS